MNKRHMKTLVTCVTVTAVLAAGFVVSNVLNSAAVAEGLTFEEQVSQQAAASQSALIGNKDLTAISDITSSSSSSQAAYDPNGDNKPSNNVIIEKTENGEKVTPDWQKPSAPTTKPTLPPGTVTTNPSSKPSYSSQPTIQSGSSSGTTSISTPTASSSSQTTTQPKDGTTRVNNGVNEIYIGGFGWVPQVQPAQGEKSGKDGEQLTGNMVGIM